MGEQILIIKHGALGDVIQADGAMRAIRAHHPDARITALTTSAMAGVFAMMPYIDAVHCDDRVPFWHIRTHLALRAFVRGARFTRIYDLQNSGRTGRYFRLFGRPAGWCGHVPGCAYPFHPHNRKQLHTLDRLRAQLSVAGIDAVPMPDLSWLGTDSTVTVPDTAVLLVCGGSAHRLDKRWPPGCYSALAQRLVADGLTPVLVGGPAEEGLAAELCAAVPQALNLIGKTGIRDMAAIARQARLAVGNDTGPMHIIALNACPSVVLYSHASDPDRCGQRGEAVTILRVPNLDTLSVEDVYAACCRLLR